jgi:cytochrome c oxidase cbb3-type subunit 3
MSRLGITAIAALLTLWIASAVVRAQASAKRPVPSAAAQKATAAQVDAGRGRFAAQCGFCHGRDAAGGETGPDLTRSAVVAEDVRGNKIGAIVRAGRPDKGMPAFSAITDADLVAIAAFLHDATAKASSLNGNRRSVAPADLETGNAEAGKRYFSGAGACSTCHDASAGGTFATVAKRYQGLALLQRMLYPASGRGGDQATPPVRPTVTVTPLPGTPDSGSPITGKLAYRDEFTIALVDADGWNRSFSLDRVKVAVQDPLQAHVDQLAKYTDADMHDVLAYILSLAK